jgi:ATP-dependent DNA ligase
VRSEGTEGRSILSPNQKNLTVDYPSVVKGIDALPVASAILDGEIVALD